MLALPASEDDVDSDLPIPPAAAAAYWARLERAAQQGDVSPTATTVLLLHAVSYMLPTRSLIPRLCTAKELQVECEHIMH